MEIATTIERCAACHYPSDHPLTHYEFAEARAQATFRDAGQHDPDRFAGGRRLQTMLMRKMQIASDHAADICEAETITVGRVLDVAIRAGTFRWPTTRNGIATYETVTSYHAECGGCGWRSGMDENRETIEVWADRHARTAGDHQKGANS